MAKKSRGNEDLLAALREYFLSLGQAGAVLPAAHRHQGAHARAAPPGFQRMRSSAESRPDSSPHLAGQHWPRKSLAAACPGGPPPLGAWRPQVLTGKLQPSPRPPSWTLGGLTYWEPWSEQDTGQTIMMMPPAGVLLLVLPTFLHTAGEPFASAWVGKDAAALEDGGQGQLAGKEGAGP